MPLITASPYKLQPTTIADATYDGISFGVATQDNAPTGVQFKPDGTKMYIVGFQNDSVYQYTLSTPWLLSSASYDSVSASVSQDASPQGIAFKPDGTKMYMVGDIGNKTYQYTLSTPWDMSTLTYDTVSFNLVSSGGPYGIAFKSDGTKMHVSGFNQIHEYDLSVAWDLSTATYNSVVLDISTLETGDVYGFDVQFNADGSKMFLGATDATGGSVFNNIYQYSMGTPWDLSTASYSSFFLDVSPRGSDLKGIAFGNSDTKMYIVNRSADAVFQYSL